MTRNRKPHEDIRFSAKKISGAGILSVLFSIVSMVLFPAAVWISCSYDGQAGAQVGAVGMLALIIGLLGGVLGASEMRNDEVSQRLPRIGAHLGFAAVLLWAVIFIIGLRA